MTPEERRDRARKAALARWKKAARWVTGGRSLDRAASDGPVEVRRPVGPAPV